MANQAARSLSSVCIREWMLSSNVSNVMITRQILAIVAPTLARSVRRWIFHLGGLGFIPLGLLDSSVIPLPGSMDILTIVLSARKKELWLYYTLMATIGSVIGGYSPTGLLAKAGRKRSNANSRPGRSKGFTGYSGVGALELSRSQRCCHRQRPWFHFFLPQAQCNTPWENFWRR